MICHCSLAGTQACKNCPRYKQYFGEQMSFSSVAFYSEDELIKAHKDNKRPEGKWVEHEKKLDTYYCSNCKTDALYYFGKPFGQYLVSQVKSEYCPRCGADMRGKE